MLSLFDKFKRGPFLKASGVTTKFSIHFYSIEQSLAIFQGISDQLEILDLILKYFEVMPVTKMRFDKIRDLILILILNTNSRPAK